jgi:hypothetical protein
MFCEIVRVTMTEFPSTGRLFNEICVVYINNIILHCPVTTLACLCSFLSTLFFSTEKQVRTDERGFMLRFLFLFYKESISTAGPTQHPIQWAVLNL